MMLQKRIWRRFSAKIINCSKLLAKKTDFVLKPDGISSNQLRREAAARQVAEVLLELEKMSILGSFIF